MVVDDAHPQLATAQSEHRFPCDQCGSDMRFAPGDGGLICDHCGHERATDDDMAAPDPMVELDYAAALKAQVADHDIEQTRVSSCPSCGAQVTFAPAIHAKECPFCATPVVTDTGTHRHIKPKALVPFQLTERQAHDAMIAWLGRLWFAPNGLKDYAKTGRKMDGIYIPYWTFDAATATQYRGKRGDAYYVTVKNAKGETRRERRIRWSNRRGRLARVFDDVLVLASASLPKTYTDRLQPWDLTKLEPYNPEFLSGFRAEGYGVDLDAGFEEGKQIMQRQIRRDVKRDIGGDEQRILHMQTQFSDITFKHILLPIWIAAYQYKNKSYRFVVNAQSGEVQGERPWSVIKIALAFVGLGLIAAVVVVVYALTQS
jgi:hypothetical protein